MLGSFKKAVARLFNNHHHRLNVAARRCSEQAFRPRVEWLDGRVMPASLTWTNLLGNGVFDTAGNWRVAPGVPSSQPPTFGDELIFDGTVTSASCTGAHGFGLPDTTADYGSIQLVNGYNGTVSFVPEAAPSPVNKGVATAFLTLTSGAISQPAVNTELSVLAHFNWTGGVLGGTHANPLDPNFTPSYSMLHLLGGSTATVNPGQANTITAGSTLSFENVGTTGSTGTFLPGTVQLVGIAGVLVGNSCHLTINTQAVGRFALNGTDSNLVQGEQHFVLYEGAMLSIFGSGSTTVGNKAVMNLGGLIHVGSGTYWDLSGAKAPTFYPTPFVQTSGSTVIEGGGTIDVGTKQFYATGGRLEIARVLGDAGPAVLKGGFWNNGATITFIADTYWTFAVIGDVTWSAGTFKPRVNAAVDAGLGQTDVWWVRGKLTIPAGSTAQIVPVLQNLPAAGLPAAFSRRIVILDQGSVGGLVEVVKNIPTDPATRYNVHVSGVPNDPYNEWRLRPD